MTESSLPQYDVASHRLATDIQCDEVAAEELTGIDEAPAAAAPQNPITALFFGIISALSSIQLFHHASVSPVTAARTMECEVLKNIIHRMAEHQKHQIKQASDRREKERREIREDQKRSDIKRDEDRRQQLRHDIRTEEDRRQQQRFALWRSRT